jgi:hypothetical protein
MIIMDKNRKKCDEQEKYAYNQLPREVLPLAESDTGQGMQKCTCEQDGGK